MHILVSNDDGVNALGNVALRQSLARIADVYTVAPEHEQSAKSHAISLLPGLAVREILRHPLFLRLAPLALFQYGGLIAVQALWAGPWLTQVGGRTPAEAAAGLFVSWAPSVERAGLVDAKAAGASPSDAPALAPPAAG